MASRRRTLPPSPLIAEQQRLEEDARREKHWKRWGPYLSERAWGTVREDYSPYGTAWEYFPHDHARSRAYRWNEDGLAGICDRHQYLCFAIALWNGHDSILKERVFGLTGNEGNHGEDVKEYYFYLDSTPTHSYMKYLYKYPQAAFPYAQLVEENRRRGRKEFEFELINTGCFDENRYFDVFVEYAKASPEDLCIRIQIVNRGTETAELTLLPTIWYRNTWSWGSDIRRPRFKQGEPVNRTSVIETNHDYYGLRRLLCEGQPTLLFTENETNSRRLYGDAEGARYVKDSFHDYVVRGDKEAVNPDQIGSKAAAHYTLSLAPGASDTIHLRLTNEENEKGLTREAFNATFTQRIQEANEFYDELAPPDLSEDARRVQRQAFAGLLWSKQFYHYDANRWLKGDPGPEPPRERLHGRNSDWTHLYNADVISMPDKWEYPWYAAWDLAFHCIPLALVDATFAKEQLILMLREWYMHPNGQIPAYEWAFGDVNPPVHAWAAWRVYKIEQETEGRRRSRVLGAGVSQATSQFHLVGESQGCRGKEHLSGRISGPRQHRGVRPQRAAANRRPHRTVRRDQLDGHVLPQHADDRVGTGQRQSGVRGRRQQVLRALRLHLPRHEQHRRRENRALGSRRRILLRRAAPAERTDASL